MTAASDTYVTPMHLPACLSTASYLKQGCVCLISKAECVQTQVPSTVCIQYVYPFIPSLRPHTTTEQAILGAFLCLTCTTKDASKTS